LAEYEAYRIKAKSHRGALSADQYKAETGCVRSWILAIISATSAFALRSLAVFHPKASRHGRVIGEGKETKKAAGAIRRPFSWRL